MILLWAQCVGERRLLCGAASQRHEEPPFLLPGGGEGSVTVSPNWLTLSLGDERWVVPGKEEEEEENGNKGRAQR